MVEALTEREVAALRKDLFELEFAIDAGIIDERGGLKIFATLQHLRSEMNSYWDELCRSELHDLLMRHWRLSSRRLDCEDWCKLPVWRLEEIKALSLGIDPKSI